MDVQAQTVEEFCQAHRISRGTFYNLLKDGRGPRVMKVGARTLVGTEAAADWRRRMEQQGVDGKAAA
jgi:predicted DNA-binding transcriptional regulator AlpA